jgi:hypothetical protein
MTLAEPIIYLYNASIDKSVAWVGRLYDNVGGTYE